MTEPAAVRIAAELQVTAERMWGAARAEALAASIDRLAGALTTVEAFSLAGGVEPFPTGPVRRGGILREGQP